MITVTNSPRFLISQTAFIGDVILATALLEQLHQAQPDAVLDVLVRKGNESLLANHPFVNEVLIWDKKGAKYRSLWTLLQTIRSRKYDAVLNLQRFGTTGLLTAFSGAKTTVGFTKNPFSRFFTHRIEHRIEPGIHEIQRNAELLKPLNLASPIVRLTRPKLYPSVADYNAVRIYQNKPYICIAPTSVWFTKQYPSERWIELIQKLPGSTVIYLLGAPADAQACNAMIARAGLAPGSVINLAGRLSLLQSAALQAGAAMNYVNDSAPLHLCSAMNAPTTAVFCSTVPEFGFGPLADQSRVVQTTEELDCKPCNLHGKSACPLGHFRCAWGISVDEMAHFQ
ncbi:glycosyltransferase family 9 protein [Spirosoma aureum]|uniref:Glycosyltransferase family 9 protein n=1 Tax=Spirosoma aureum TaxID=2692134 RepID=A0A6G9ALP4_9BACT|nr:glycosyltransferase family 9 protein [Spirosoma aureum]QIP13338.1 glycosyltransferase family 9 protein [Spirosoma aureum]